MRSFALALLVFASLATDRIGPTTTAGDYNPTTAEIVLEQTTPGK